MLSNDSPLINIPAALNAKEAVFFDGIRHALQICDYSYKRLSSSLTEQAVFLGEARPTSAFIPIFLDAWAFIDAADRFRSLWEMSPSSKSFSGKLSPRSVRDRLQGIRELRNVSSHIAQKIDQIVSLNSSVLGSISWLTKVNDSPLAIKTCFIRPGLFKSSANFQFAVPNKPVHFVNGSGCTSVFAGKHNFLLDDAYQLIVEIAASAENYLAQFPPERYPADVFGIADLNV